MELKYFIPLVLGLVALLLAVYDKSEMKVNHLKSISSKLSKIPHGEVEPNIARLYQVLLGFVFLFSAGITLLYIVSILVD